MEKIEWEKWFYYDETSPSRLRWAKDVTNTRHYKSVIRYKGDVAGSLHTDGYWYNTINRKTVPTHRVVWELLKGDTFNLLIDHIDGDCLNNSIDNLRLIKKEQNSRNCKMSSKNTSGVTGVRASVNQSGKVYFSAFWVDLNGTVKSKCFNVHKLGVMVAFRDAVMYREKMIKELNEQGAGYSERHGK